MTYAQESAQAVGKTTRGELARDLCLVEELLELVNRSFPDDGERGISAATEIAQRMIARLASQVSP